MLLVPDIQDKEGLKSDVVTYSDTPDIFTPSAPVVLSPWLQLSSLIKQQLWSKETLQATYVCNAQKNPSIPPTLAGRVRLGGRIAQIV